MTFESPPKKQKVACDVLELHGNACSVSVKIDRQDSIDKLSEVSFINSKSGDVLAWKALFGIKQLNDELLSSSSFALSGVVKHDDRISISFKTEEFTVTGDIYLHKEQTHMFIDLAFLSMHDGRKVQALSVLPFNSRAPFVYGSINSSPVISDNFFVVPQNPLMNTRAYEGGVTQMIPITLPMMRGKALVYRTYIGTYSPGQLRRDFNVFLNDVRPRKYDPYLHYNSWLDIGFFNPYSEKDGLTRIHEFGEELVRKRGVSMSGFLFDDGWDDLKGDWAFSKHFPNGFKELKTAADMYNAQLGIWFSPWGGYGKPCQERVSNAKELGYELSDGRFALSGPVYYENFHRKVTTLIKEQSITHFKFDGTGNANKVIEGSQFTSDFDAAIHLMSAARAANERVYINLTTGTTASPSWLFFADSIWRDGDDINFYGFGSKVQQWITYRDAETHRSVVRKGPLFPLNSLMLHGLVYAKQAAHLDKQSPQDFADQAWSYFATGTQLQEMYVTPELLSDEDWNILAKAAQWSKENKDILFDTHWVGGDPTLSDVYGWAAWSKRKSILTLRNPSAENRAFLVDLKRQLEIPNGESKTFKALIVYGSDAGMPAKVENVVVINLEPLALVTIELEPIS